MANWWTLKILSGPEAGKIYNMKKDRTVIGRVKGDIVMSSDNELSSIHAEIIYDSNKGVMILQDLRSRNGTRVNGDKVEKRALLPGDKIKFGLSEFVLEPPTSEETVMVRSPNAPPETKSALPTAEAAKAAKAADEKPNATEIPAKEADSAKKAPKSTRVRPDRYDNYDSAGVGPTEFHGFVGRFFGVLLFPTRFFDFLASENALISGDQAFKTSLKFGALNWLGGGMISTVLSYYCMFVWKTKLQDADFGNSPLAIALGTLIGLFVLPLVALVYHYICLALGGKGPFKVAIRVLCYISAVHFVKDLAGLVPKFGPFLNIVLTAYILYLLALASTRLYYVSTRSAFVSCAVSTALTITILLSSQQSALRMQDELTKLNPILKGSIGATISRDAPSSVEQRDPAATEKLAPPEQRDTLDAAPAGDSEPPSIPSSGGDPEPPVLPSSVN